MPDPAEIVVRTEHFDADVAELVEHLGFRIEAIHPADAPRTAVVSGHAVRLRIERGACRPVTLRIPSSPGRDAITLAGGTIVEFPPVERNAELPPNRPSLVVTHPDEAAAPGRAGMRYHDLIPDRWGGRYIASLITIPEGGPVPDYVHFHRVRFQLIVVRHGWVRVVYQGQGEPFIMGAGDCVIQPPGIRHRVLEASPGLEVIEVSCPAEHETIADWSTELPDDADGPSVWEGQRFVRHVAAEAADPEPWLPGWRRRSTGISEATGGTFDVGFLRPSTADRVEPQPLPADDELTLLVVMDGGVELVAGDRPSVALTAGSSVAIPRGTTYRLGQPSDDCEVLHVAVPG